MGLLGCLVVLVVLALLFGTGFALGLAKLAAVVWLAGLLVTAAVTVFVARTVGKR